MQQQSNPTFERQSRVIYRASCGDFVTAIIKTCHRDGSYTVEAGNVLRKDGTPIPCYLGFFYRLSASELQVLR